MNTGSDCMEQSDLGPYIACNIGYLRKLADARADDKMVTGGKMV